MARRREPVVVAHRSRPGTAIVHGGSPVAQRSTPHTAQRPTKGAHMITQLSTVRPSRDRLPRTTRSIRHLRPPHLSPFSSSCPLLTATGKETVVTERGEEVTGTFRLGAPPADPPPAYPPARALVGAQSGPLLQLPVGSGLTAEDDRMSPDAAQPGEGRGHQSRTIRPGAEVAGPAFDEVGMYGNVAVWTKTLGSLRRISSPPQSTWWRLSAWRISSSPWTSPA
jgi:hypothetical protein